MQKKDLAKLAIAALMLAAASHTVQAEGANISGTLLAAGCAAHGCNSPKKSEISDNSPASTDAYNANNSYRSSKDYNTNYGTTGTSSSSGNIGTGAGSSSYSNPSSSSTYASPSYSSSNNSNRSSGSNSDWNTNYNRGGSTDWNANRTYGAGASTNRDANTDTYSTTERSYTDTYVTPDAYGTATATASTFTVTDEDFRKQLDSQTKPIFDGFSRSDKDSAKSLANDPSYKDKNAAVREVQRRAAK